MRKPINILLAIWLLLVLFVIGCGLLGMTGCRSVELQKSKTMVDSTASQKSTYDSSSSKVWDWLLQFGKITEKTYGQGRDTPIILKNGEVQIIQLPGQLIKERTIETRTEKASGEEKTQVSKTDSLLVELLRKDSSKEKESSSIPVWGWIAIAGVGYLLLRDLIQSPKNRLT